MNSLSFDGGLHYITEEAGGASILELIGGAIAWLFLPLGFGSWQAAVATVLGLVAKEEVVGTFGTLSSMASADLAMEGDAAMYAVIAKEFFGGSSLAGMSFMIFNLLAYAASLIVYQLGSWFVGEGDILGTSAAMIVLLFILYMLFRKKNVHETRAELLAV